MSDTGEGAARLPGTARWQDVTSTAEPTVHWQDVSGVIRIPADLHARAAQIGAARQGPFRLSFTSLALGLFASADPFCRWLRRHGADLGERIQRAAGVSDDVLAAARAGAASSSSGSIGAPPAGPSQEVTGRATSSAAKSTISPSALKLLGESYRIARIVSGGPVGEVPGTAALFAAYCFGEGIGHDEDLAAWGFDRTVWTRRLLAWVAMRAPGELTGWLEAAGGDGPLDFWSRDWLRNTSHDELGQRDAASVLDGLFFRSETPNLGGLATSRGWSPTVRAAPKGTPSEIEVTDEVHRWAALAEVLAWPERPFPDQALMAAAVAAPPDALPGVSAWFDARGTSLEAEEALLWRWATEGVSTSDGWADVSRVWAEVAPPALASFDNDEARGGEDRLDFARDVAALAQLIAADEARGIRPPLSVGLFGDWGTGKTFFMDLLERKIDELKGSGEPAFCQRIVQIRFNAWHYMDANLWASLAVHMFDDLERQLAKGETAAQREARVGHELSSARVERERLDRERSALEGQLERLRGLAAVAEKERVDRRLALADLRAVDVRSVLLANPDLAARMERLDDAARAASTVRAFFGRTTIVFALATAAALAAGLYLGSELIGHLATAVGGVVTVITGLVGALRRAVPRGEELIALFAEVEARARARPSEEEERLGGEIAAADISYQELVGACTRLVADVARLEAEKQQLADGRNFMKYVLQRSRSDDYRKQLGIVSTLQRDFDELSRRFLVDDAGARVQRIVLYIDDLDRCPADKVVQVLQAVHLLLSFPLFVVVVAVDPTWVLRSLEEHYARQMGGGAAPGVPAATPHAYLEKIFQIPMRVRPMGVGAYRRLIDGMAGGQVVEAPVTDGPADRDIAEGDERDEPADAMFEGVDRDDRAEPQAGPGARGVREAEPGPTGEALTLEPHELEYLKRLGALVPTPRAAKRMMNVYRLVRVQLRPRERARFVRDEDGTFHALMLFLALNARFPQEALTLFGMVAAAPSAGTWVQLRQLAAGIHRGAGQAAWHRLWWETLPADQPVRSPLERLRWAQIADAAALAARYSLPGVGASAGPQGDPTAARATAAEVTTSGVESTAASAPTSPAGVAAALSGAPRAPSPMGTTV